MQIIGMTDGGVKVELEQWFYLKKEILKRIKILLLIKS
jgi:hypothetical protein